jgi:hypothetical protein
MAEHGLGRVVPMPLSPPGEAARVREAAAFAPGVVLRLAPEPLDPGAAAWRALVEDAGPGGLWLRLLGGREPPPSLRAGARCGLVSHAGREALAATVVVQEVRAGVPPIVVTGPPSGVRLVGRRGFYRVDVDLPTQGPGWRGRVVNLSGSGCLMAIERGGPVGVGTTLRLALHLPTRPEPLWVDGRVVRTRRLVMGHAVGVEFVDLSRRDQDELVRYVTRRQSELLRKGVLSR